MGFNTVKYLGIITLVRVKNGILAPGQKIQMMSNKASYEIEKVGIFTPKIKEVKNLMAGEIGFVTAGIKKVADCKIWDTITEKTKPCSVALTGFKPSHSLDMGIQDLLKGYTMIRNAKYGNVY